MPPDPLGDPEPSPDPDPDPSHYDGHVERIKRLREKGDLTLLRQARETMNITFPLSPG